MDLFSYLIGKKEGGGGELGTKTITANGTYSARADNLDGYSSVTVAIPLYDEEEF